MVQLGQYPKARQVLVHLSDTHFLSGGAPLHGDLPAESNLERALEQVESMGISPSALVFTGDLTDEGETDAYARLRERVEPVARRLGAEVIWLMGNHDERGAMRSALLDEDPSDAPMDRVWDLGGLRFIGLDSSVPGFHHGELTDAQLDWLDGVLDVPARLGTVIGMHHPPVPAPQPLFDLLELRHQRPFAEVLAGRDVRAILAGHLHYSLSSTFADVPVSVAAQGPVFLLRGGSHPVSVRCLCLRRAFDHLFIRVRRRPPADAGGLLCNPLVPTNLNQRLWSQAPKSAKVP